MPEATKSTPDHEPSTSTDEPLEVPDSQRERPFRFTVQASHLAHPDELVPLARKAESLGVSVLTVADHLDDQLAPIPAMMAAAMATTDLRVGSMVLSNDYRHPLMLAKEAATVDVLTGGRLEFGIGAGWMTEDYRMAGMPMDRPGVRIARLEEAIRLILAAWGGEQVDFSGEHYRVTDYVGVPLPHQRPHPPLFIGGGGRRILSLAGRHADIVGLNPILTSGVIDENAGPSATRQATERKIRWIREAAGDRFDQIEIQTRIHLVLLTDDREGVFDALAGGFGLTPAEAAETPHALCGTVDQIVDDLIERRETLGISSIGISAASLDDVAPVIERLAGV